MTVRVLFVIATALLGAACLPLASAARRLSLPLRNSVSLDPRGLGYNYDVRYATMRLDHFDFSNNVSRGSQRRELMRDLRPAAPAGAADFAGCSHAQNVDGTRTRSG
jgi:hypothetical protein